MVTYNKKARNRALRAGFPLLAGLIVFLSACSAAIPQISAPPEPPLGQTSEIVLEAVPEDLSFSFVFVSDPQPDPETGEYGIFADIIKLAREKAPDFILSGGDHVNDGRNAEEWGALKALVGDIPFWPVVGNHDNPVFLFDYFPLNEEEVVSRNGNFYSFTHKGVHFLMLDSNLMGAGNDEDVEWIRGDLEANAGRFNIVVMHHPPYLALDVIKDEERAEVIREKFLPVFEEYKVDLVLCGHEHCYMRTLPMKDGQIAEDGITYLMVVSGDKQYTPFYKDYFAKAQPKQPVFLIVDVGEVLSGRVLNRENEKLDSFVIEEKE